MHIERENLLSIYFVITTILCQKHILCPLLKPWIQIPINKSQHHTLYYSANVAHPEGVFNCISVRCFRATSGPFASAINFPIQR